LSGESNIQASIIKKAPNTNIEMVNKFKMINSNQQNKIEKSDQSITQTKELVRQGKDIVLNVECPF